MATTVAMPKLGLTMEEGTVNTWLKQAGDTVREGEPICEIATEKITYTLEAPAAGVLSRILVENGVTVPCQTPIGLIGEPGEAEPGAPALAGAGTGASPGAPAGRAAETPAVGGRVRISPLARKMARRSGIDTATLVGTGPTGRIVMADVVLATAERAATQPDLARATAPARDGPKKPAGASLVPLTPMRKVIAERMTASLRQGAQLTLTTTVDAGALMALRTLMVQQTEQALGYRISVNDFVIRAVVLALAQHPNINVSWTEGGILHHRSINVGVAVDVPGGLLVPVLTGVDAYGLAALNRQVAGLSDRARDGKLTPGELEGGTFTVSNLGMFGIAGFTPIINPPQSAILGIGCVRAVPVVKDGAVVPGHELVLSLTIDHRVIDGAPGARFLATVRELLEQPARLAV